MHEIENRQMDRFFYIASKEESERQISVADEFIILAEKYCLEQLEQQKEN